MVRGIENFREWFRGYEDQYVIIGGTACDLLMTEEGLDFRATKDIDLVLIIEAVNVAFGDRFWEYIIAAGYEHRNKSTGKSQLYRFTNPQSKEYPAMIELFTRKPDAIILPEDAMLSPLPMYEFLRQGKIQISGVTVLSAPYLIPFKAKAWLDLSRRKSEGDQVDSRNIRKHKNDIFRLTELLDRNMAPLIYIPDAIRSDINEFTERMRSEDVDLQQIGIRNKSKEAILDQLNVIYNKSGAQ